MNMLDYTLLHKLERCLEVTDVDVRRLRDDRSEIRLGDEIAFVATASFRLTHEAVKQLDEVASGHPIKQLAVGDKLLAIGSDAELSADLPIDLDGVTGWLADRFRFTFLLDGADHAAFRPVGQVHIAGGGKARSIALPWIRSLSTAAIKGDYIDVDVAIEPAPQVATPAANTAIHWPIAEATATVADQPLIARLAIDSDQHAVDLIGHAFTVPVESSHGRFRFSLTFERETKAQAKPAAPAGGSSKK